MKRQSRHPLPSQLALPMRSWVGGPFFSQNKRASFVPPRIGVRTTGSLIHPPPPPPYLRPGLRAHSVEERRRNSKLKIQCARLITHTHTHEMAGRLESRHGYTRRLSARRFWGAGSKLYKPVMIPHGVIWHGIVYYSSYQSQRILRKSSTNNDGP